MPMRCPVLLAFVLATLPIVLTVSCSSAWALGDLAEVFVAPDGDDSGPGTNPRPFATLARARDAARERIARGLKEDLQIVLEDGVYRLTEPLVLGPQDGGTDKFSVTWMPPPFHHPVISGGRVITGWKKDGEVWRTTIPEVKAGAWTFNELYVAGRRRPRARHPNDGWARVEKVIDDRRKFTWKEGEVPALADVGEAQLLLLHDWSVTRVRIASMDAATRTLTTAGRVGASHGFFRINGFEAHPRYRIENHAALLDAPGEWYLDTKTGVLSYRPMKGEAIGKTETIAPVARQLLVVRGDAASGKPVRNLRFSGLTFEHCAWTFDDGRYAGVQAAFHCQGSDESGWGNRELVTPAVEFAVADGCVVTGCRLRHLGGSGLRFGRACHDCVLRASVVGDVAGNGVMLGEEVVRSGRDVASGNRVEHSRIVRCGQRFFGAVGVWVGLSAGNVITRSEIAHHPYTGISVGWRWNPTPSPCKANEVTATHIHHCMQILSDGGGIYTLGRQPGTRLAGNHIHDIPLNAGRAESNGMFLDEGTTELVIEANLIHDTVRSPLRFHKAGENLVKDNIVTLRKGVPIVRYNATPEKNITLQDNTVVPHEKRGEAFEKEVERMGKETGPKAEWRKRLGDE